MTRAVHVPYTLEQDEDGVWCAHAQLRPGVGANGEGDTPEAAIADLREAVEGLIALDAPDRRKCASLQSRAITHRETERVVSATPAVLA